MKQLRFIVLCAAAWIGMASIAVAQSEANERVSNESSLRKLRELIESDPRNLDYYFEFAQMATAMGELEHAEQAYKNMLYLDPKLDRVRLDLAAVYMRMERWDEARAVFEDVLSRSPPDQVQANVKSLLAQITEAEKKHKFSGVITFGINHDSNANSAPDSGNISVFDTTIPLSGSQKEQEDFHAYTSVVAEHNYRFDGRIGDNVITRWRTTGSLYQSKQSDFDNLDIGLLGIETGPEFTFTKENVKIHPSVHYNYITLDGEEYLKQLAGELSGEIALNAQWLLYTSGRYEDRTFENAPGITTYDDRSGDAQHYTFGARFAPTAKDIFDASLAFRKEETERRYYDNDQLLTNLGYTRLFDHNIFASLRAGYKGSSYDGPDLLISRKTRDDDELSGGLTVGKGFAENWIASAGYQYRTVSSNIQNYEYDNHRFMTSLGYRF